MSMTSTMLKEQKKEELVVSEKKKPRVATVCPENFPGVTQTMRAMEATGYTKHYPYSKDKGFSSDIYEYDYIILGGWIDDYETVIKRHKRCSILWCSSLGQMEQSGEMQLFNKVSYLANRGDLDMLLVGSRDLYYAMSGAVRRIMYMPYPVFDKEIPEFNYRRKRANTIGFFMPTHPRKNILNQLYAVVLLSRNSSESLTDITLVTNINGVTSSKGLNVENTGWLRRKTYLNAIKRVKVGLHVTHTESFGQQALEYMLAGTPVILSPVVAVNLEVGEELAPLVVWNVDSVVEISQRLFEILTMKEEDYKFLSQKVYVHAKSLANKRNNEFRMFMEAFTNEKGRDF